MEPPLFVREIIIELYLQHQHVTNGVQFGLLTILLCLKIQNHLGIMFIIQLANLIGFMRHLNAVQKIHRFAIQTIIRRRMMLVPMLRLMRPADQSVILECQARTLPPKKNYEAGIKNQE